MKGVLDSVNQRTQLVGQNRLELLTFRLNEQQRYGINVFKVREVLMCPALIPVPNGHPWIRGLAQVRGQTVSVIDMSLATGNTAINLCERSFIIITEFNRMIQGFLVSSVDRIVNLNWETVLPPPSTMGNDHYLTAVTKVDDALLAILDVEKILSLVSPVNETISSSLLETAKEINIGNKCVLIVDDSSVARKQVERVMVSMGLPYVTANNGMEAWHWLKDQSLKNNIYDVVGLVISDIEMPEMDGYTLTTQIRQDPKLNKLKVMLHTSLSGVFNRALVERVQADAFIPKFNPEELGNAVFRTLLQAQTL
jgi:two-component system chemotaxis response regulator CheV